MGSAALETSQDPGGAEVTADMVLRAHFTLTSIDGAIECIDLEGAEGWTSPNPHPALSLMRWTTTDPKRAARSLDDALERFSHEGRSLEWMTGPACREAGLLPLLDERGFDPDPMHIAAMSKTLTSGDDVETLDTDNGEVRTCHMTGSLKNGLGRIMARGFSVPDAVGEIYHRAYMTPTALQTSDVYAAWTADRSGPIGVGYLTYLGDGKDVLLRASSVLEAARGHGAYKALVLHRLRDAAARGCREAFVHAYSKGSRSCLTGLGFRTLGGLSLHVWSPEG